MSLVILAALRLEVRPFLRQRRARPLSGFAIPAWEFQAANRRGILALSGMGEHAAARAAGLVWQHFHPEMLISCGFGGALTPALPPGALVLGQSFFRYQTESEALIPLAAPPLPCPLPVLEAALRRAGLPVWSGALVTTPVVINKAKQGKPLKSLIHPVLDLETGAVATVAVVHHVPCVTLRVVTDTAQEEVPDYLIRAAASGTEPGPWEALGWVAQDLRRAAVLVRLWRRAHLGARRLAQALKVLVEVSEGGSDQ